MKKRVLQFIGSLHQGGSERQAIELTRLLVNEGTFDVFLSTLNSSGVLRPEVEDIGFSAIPEFPLTSFYNANFVKQLRLCSRYLAVNKIDLVHTHDFYSNVFGIAAAKLAGVPVRVASRRETGGVRSRLQGVVERAAFRNAKAVVANSLAVREYLVKHGVAPSKIHIVHNGIKPGRFDVKHSDPVAVRKRFGLPSDGNVRFITMVANLRHPVKNVSMLLRTAERVIESWPRTHFVIAGEGALQTGLRESARQLGIAGNVHFIGRCSDVPALLSITYACILTSIAEGFSNAILEYMAAAKPVVATSVGGASEAIVNGESGYLVDSDDDEAMASGLIELLGDEKKAAAFGVIGRCRVAERFSDSSQLCNTLNLYNSLLR